MLPDPSQQQSAGGPPPAAAPLSQPAPGLASAPGQNSALGGSPVGLGGSSDPTSILKKAQLLLKSGAISEQQFQMILAKLQGGQGAKPGMPAGPPGASPSPLSTTGVPGGGPPVGGPAPGAPMQPPSQQWNM